MPRLIDQIGKSLVTLGTGQSFADQDAEVASAKLLEQQARITQSEADALEDVPNARAREQQLATAAMNGSDEALKQLFVEFPERGEQLLEGIGAIDDRDKQRVSERAFRLASLPPEDQTAELNRQISEGIAAGRDMSDSMRLLLASPEERANTLRFMQEAGLSVNERIDNQNKQRELAQADQGIEQTNERLQQGERGLDLREQELGVRQEERKAAESLKASERITKEVEQELKTEQGLRKEVNALLKDFFQVADAYGRVLAASESPSAAGDLALIFNYMKMLDPGSTVREGEFATAQNSAGVPGRVVSLYNNVLRGERLNTNQRADFLGQAENLAASAQDGAQKTANAYELIATNAGVNVENILATFNERTIDTGNNEAKLLEEARSAISEGADRSEVEKRLQSMGVDPSKL